MTEALDIIVVGFELDQSQVEAGIVRVFGIDAQQARRLLREIPVVAKGGASRSLAERYVSALRSIGARVELRPSGSSSTASRAPGVFSLPLPTPALIARVDESIRVQREAALAIKRFRDGEGLEHAESLHAIDPKNPTLDLWNPAIPKAPPIPQDLAKMRNAARSRLSDPPSWMLTDPPDGIDVATGRPHNDAQPPPPLELDLAYRPQPSDPHPSDHSAVRTRRGSVGIAHAATASIRPGLSPYYARPGNGPRLRRSRLRALRPLLVLLAALAVGALLYWLSGGARVLF